MGVLQIINRVVVAARGGTLQVEVHRDLALGEDVMQPRRVDSDRLNQISQQHELAGAGRHTYPLASVDQCDELNDAELQPLGFVP